MRVDFDVKSIAWVQNTIVFKTRDFKIETISKPSKDSLIYGEKPKE
jgi:hypothetical protein